MMYDYDIVVVRGYENEPSYDVQLYLSDNKQDVLHCFIYVDYQIDEARQFSFVLKSNFNIIEDNNKQLKINTDEVIKVISDAVNEIASNFKNSINEVFYSYEDGLGNWSYSSTLIHEGLLSLGWIKQDDMVIRYSVNSNSVN